MNGLQIDGISAVNEQNYFHCLHNEFVYAMRSDKHESTRSLCFTLDQELGQKITVSTGVLCAST